MGQSRATPLERESVGDAALRLARHGVAVATNGAMRLMHRPRVIMGIEISPWFIEERWAPVFFGRTRRALELIERYDPRRLARIRHDVRMIGGTVGHNSKFDPDGRIILLTRSLVLRATAADVAMTIVHEATHARIIDRGIHYFPVNRARIEAACVRQEAAFARRLPGGDALADRGIANLEHAWWTPRRIHESNLDVLRELELPAWADRWLARVSLRRAAREEARAGQSRDAQP